MNCLFSLVFVFKLSICVVALSSLYSKLRFSPVASYVFRPLKELSKFQLATKCQSMKQQYQLYVCLLAKNNLNDTRKRNLYQILRMCVCVCVFFSTTNGRVQVYNISPKIIFPQKCPIWKYFFSKNSSDSQIGLGLRPRLILAVLGIFSSNYSKLDSMQSYYIQNRIIK